jgi:tetratricopeptide (TPR) repeat protein
VAARVLPRWSGNLPGYGYLLGMLAFGHEECGEYREAERAGRRAVEMYPGDHWATHAVAHVMEMEGRHHDGIAWLDGLKVHWEGGNNFINHLWWHRAMYHWELEQFDTVLELYDQRFRKEPSDFYLDIQNAVSMLWRLELRGIGVGGRWGELAEMAETHLNDLQLPFSDLHYLMALLRDGRREAAVRILDAMRQYGAGQTTYAPIVKAVNLPVSEALVAFTEGRFGETVDKLLPVRRELHKTGGSHAQRDVVALTLIEAALRAERHELARSLLDERTRARPTSPGSWRAYARALEATKDAAAAEQARAKAESLLKAS